MKEKLSDNIFSEVIYYFLRNRPIITYLKCVPENQSAVININIWKAIGLILSDGNFSDIIKKHANISFKGVSYATAYAILRTFIPFCYRVKINVRKKDQGHKETIYYNISFTSHNIISKEITRGIIEGIHNLNNNFDEMIATLEFHELVALFAGIIDGDGYIGIRSGYNSISYDISTIKGIIIDRIIGYLDDLSYIKRNKYYTKPKFEQIITFTNIKFLEELSKYIYHPKRKRRLMRDIKNLKKKTECGFSKDEISQILKSASSAYVDKRKNRKSNILVVYISISNYKPLEEIFYNSETTLKPKPIFTNKRVMIKISEKCVSILEELMKETSLSDVSINEKILTKVNEFVEHSK